MVYNLLLGPAPVAWIATVILNKSRVECLNIMLPAASYAIPVIYLFFHFWKAIYGFPLRSSIDGARRGGSTRQRGREESRGVFLVLDEPSRYLRLRMTDSKHARSIFDICSLDYTLSLPPCFFWGSKEDRVSVDRRFSDTQTFAPLLAFGNSKLLYSFNFDKEKKGKVKKEKRSWTFLSFSDLHTTPNGQTTRKLNCTEKLLSCSLKKKRKIKIKEKTRKLVSIQT